MAELYILYYHLERQMKCPELPNKKLSEYLKCAEAELRKALLFDPESTDAHFYLGKVLAIFNKKEQAIAALAKSLELGGTNILRKMVDEAGRNVSQWSAQRRCFESVGLPVLFTKAVIAFCEGKPGLAEFESTAREYLVRIYMHLGAQKDYMVDGLVFGSDNNDDKVLSFSISWQLELFELYSYVLILDELSTGSQGARGGDRFAVAIRVHGLRSLVE